MQIVAQGGGEGGLVAGLDVHRIDQRRPQIGALRTQQIGERLRLGREPLGLAFCDLKGIAQFGLGQFGFVELCARNGERFAGLGDFGARGFRGGLGGANVRCGGRAVHRLVEFRLCFGQLLRTGFGQGGGHFEGAFLARFARVPFGEIGIEPFEQALGFVQRVGQFDGAPLRIGEFFFGAGRGGFQCAGFFGERGERGGGVGLQRLFAGGVLVGLGEALANALRGFAGAGLFGIQRVTLDDEAMQRGGALRFCLA